MINYAKSIYIYISDVKQTKYQVVRLGILYLVYELDAQVLAKGFKLF